VGPAVGVRLDTRGQEDIPPLPDAIEAFKAALNRCREVEERLTPSDEGGRLVNLESTVYTQDVHLSEEGIHDANRSDLYQWQ
jgi:hypothetical protein